MISFGIGIGILTVVLGVSSLFILYRHWHVAGQAWWMACRQFWLMAVTASALFTGAIFATIQPLDLHTIALGACLGALIGSIIGPLFKAPAVTTVHLAAWEKDCAHPSSSS